MLSVVDDEQCSSLHRTYCARTRAIENIMKTTLVLLVDDDKSLLTALKRALDREPYQIMTTSDAVDALALLRKHEFSVIVSDETMPGSSGMELLIAARKVCPNTTRILMTGRATVDLTIRAIN